QELLDKSVSQAPPAEAAGVFAQAVKLGQRLPQAGDLFAHGMVLVNKHAKDDPRGAVLILDAVAPAAGKQEEETLVPQRQELLERLVAKEPNDPDAATQLALLYESQHQLPKCEAILVKVGDRLGTSEGARILGQIYSQQGKYDQAHPLLAA